MPSFHSGALTRHAEDRGTSCLLRAAIVESRASRPCVWVPRRTSLIALTYVLIAAKRATQTASYTFVTADRPERPAPGPALRSEGRTRSSRPAAAPRWPPGRADWPV